VNPVDRSNDFSGLSTSKKLLLLASNALPATQVAAAIAAACWPGLSFVPRISLVLAIVYLVPPIACRLMKGVLQPMEGRIPVGSRSFFAWWMMLQAQMIFLRLPFLEELIRFVPGLYSLWLRCWGSRIGRLTYWAPGLTIHDRAYLDIGDDVVFGAGVRLTPHVLRVETDGSWLYLGTIRIGSGASIGGYALLSSGCEVGANEQTHAYLILPPFAKWHGGRRFREIRRIAAAAREA